ncbi:MAG TPA: hypothetical protein DDY34_10660 [Bacteroidales bacterium]|nr:hypothetical protein [Bacteroidales bacterium]HBQ83666.1 hypothetical protein [Bacteroidales bacterium]
MKWSPFIKRILYSPWLLAVIPATAIILLLPPLGLKYRLIIEETGKQYSTDVYADLNSDGITETIRSGKGLPYYHLLIMNSDLRVYDQWNFKDDLHPDLKAVSFGNIDNDMYMEIFAFTYKGDSLFLNINEFFEPDGIKLDRVFITKISIVNNTITSNVYPAGFYDVNGDGISEFYFSVQTGFGLEPRLCYFFDKLNYNIEIGNGVSGDEKVPKLVLHTFAENAITHGIIPCEEGGNLQISVHREADYLKISVEDDGIGRRKAAGHSLSTGKGLKITGEFYDILNQLNNRPITHSTIDLYDKSGRAAGTRVEISLPVDR